VQALIAALRIPGVDSTTKVVLTTAVLADIFLGVVIHWNE
jgi:ABC-type phosphate transport system substrate-binding protein